MFTPLISDQGAWLARYSISRRMMGPSPKMELVLSWIIKYVEPALSSWGGAMGEGGTAKTKHAKRLVIWVTCICNRNQPVFEMNR